MLAVEEHGQGRQMVRFRVQPATTRTAALGIGMGCPDALGALLAPGSDGLDALATVLGTAGLVLAVAGHRRMRRGDDHRA